MSPQTPTAEGTEPSLKSISLRRNSQNVFCQTQRKNLRVCISKWPTTAPLGPRLPLHQCVRPSIGQCGHKLILQAIVIITLKQSATG